MWMTIAFCNAVAFCAASVLLWRAERLNARLRALLYEMQDTFPEFARCPACGALVRMTGCPCKVGVCAACECAVLESEADWVDPEQMANQQLEINRQLHADLCRQSNCIEAFSIAKLQVDNAKLESDIRSLRKLCGQAAFKLNFPYEDEWLEDALREAGRVDCHD